MGPKRSPEQHLSQVTKLPKLDPALQPQSPLIGLERATNNDFSTSVKKKLASSTRTGQACDRCKVLSPLPFPATMR